MSVTVQSKKRVMKDFSMGIHTTTGKSLEGFKIS